MKSESDVVKVTPSSEATNKSFSDDLERLINMHSQENASNTPDYILSEYMRGCLNTFNTAVRKREAFWGRSVGGPERVASERIIGKP